MRISSKLLSTTITPDLIFPDFDLRVSRNHFHMKLCNARIDFKISLGLLSWLVHNYQENCILECSSATDSRSDFSLFFCNVCPQGGVDLYGDGELFSRSIEVSREIRNWSTNFYLIFYRSFRESPDTANNFSVASRHIRLL